MDDTKEAGQELPSGRFVLRIDRRLHAALRAAAAASGLSLNQHCALKLASPGSAATGPAADALARAVAVAGETLVGVVAFGSWARDEMAAGSDVDLLVIMGEEVRLERELYRRWDASPVGWSGHPVEPHFVHLPDREDRVSGLWAEAAVDGVVLFERALTVSRWLVQVRRRIAAGRLVRQRSYGQPYWVEAA